MAMVMTKPSKSGNEPRRRSAGDWLAILLTIANISWATYYYQFQSLPTPVSPAKAGKAGFSEEAAMVHTKSLAALGPRPVGSDVLELATQYVFRVAENVRKTAPGDAEVELDYFHSKPGANTMFEGKTQIYSNLKHVILRISSKNMTSLAGTSDGYPSKDAIVVNTHFDSDNWDDDASNVAVMLELSRGISQMSHEFKNSVVFLFNTGEEEGLSGAHSFITQHPWRKDVRVAVDLEAIGLGGKSSIFQSQSPSMMSKFAKAAKYPTGSVAMQEAISTGIQSDTDFDVFNKVGGASGLAYGFSDNSAVYHTKNDKLTYLKPGSLQHLGDNILPFLIEGAGESNADFLKFSKAQGDEQQPVYFDILGMYMVVYSQKSASSLNNSVITGALVILIISLLLGGFHAIVSMVLSILSIVFMWIGSLVLSALVVVILPFCSSSTVPFAAKPWLVLGLFGAPALLGAFLGQHLGFLLLQKYLSIVSTERALPKSYPIISSDDLIKWEAERWLFRSGFLQWIIVLAVGNYFKLGSCYLALFWLVSPALAYGLLSGIGTSKQVKTGTLLSGMLVPVLVSAGPVIKLSGILIAFLLKFDKFPSSIPFLSANTVVAGLTSAVVCLMLVYLISIAHNTDNKSTIVLALVGAFVLSLAAVGGGFFPPYSEDAPRPVNVVHIVDAKSDRLGRIDQNGGLDSYVTLFSNTPGDLGKEVASLEGEGFLCGNNKTLDLVSLKVKYSCHSSSNVGLGWKESEVPLFNVENDLNNEEDERITKVEIDTKISTRWTLAINTNEVEDFKIEIDAESETTLLVPFGNKTNVDGWHTVNFAGGKGAPTKFSLTLIRLEKSAEEIMKEDTNVLLKLRTDVNRVTAKVDSVLNKLPSWCSLYGQSSLPPTLAYLNVLPV